MMPMVEVYAEQIREAKPAELQSVAQEIGRTSKKAGLTDRDLMPLVPVVMEMMPGLAEGKAREALGIIADSNVLPFPANDGTPVAVPASTTQQQAAPFFPDTMRKSSKPTSTIENFRSLLRYMGAVVRFNQLSRRCEISLPDFKATTDNSDEIAIAQIYSEAARWELPESTVDRFLLVEADRHAYNPVRDYVLSLPWDGVSRLASLSACLVTPSPDIASLGVRKMLLGVIAGNFNPMGVGDPPPVLTLTGAQGAGKTTFFRNLLPATVDRGFLEGVTLDPANKDSVMEATTHALVELGELDSTFRKSDISRLKAFLTRHKDTYREPYGRRDVTRVRRSVNGATVNDKKFLGDRTGSRRFLVVEVTDVKLFEGDIQQVWAEVYVQWQNGERHALTRAETKMVEAHNGQYQQHDEVYDMVCERLNWLPYSTETKAKFVYRTATDIAQLVGLNIDKAIVNRTARIVGQLQVESGIPEALRRDRKDRYLVPISC